MSRRKPADGLEPIAVTIQRGAELTGLSAATLRRLADAGDIDSRAYGTRRRLLIWASLRDYIHDLPREAA